MSKLCVESVRRLLPSRYQALRCAKELDLHSELRPAQEWLRGEWILAPQAYALLAEYVSKDESNIRIGAIMGLGLAYAGSQKEDVLKLLSPILVDWKIPIDVIAFTAISLGLIYVGSCNDEVAQSIIIALMERSDSELGEPLTRFLCLGLGLLYLGKQEKVDATLEVAKTFNEKISRYCQVTLESCAYAGTGNVLKAATLALGLIGAGTNNARIAGMLRNLLSYYYKDPSLLFCVHTSKRACASTYPSLQQQGIIWFWPNNDPQFKDIALEKKPPLIPVLSDPSFPCTLSMRDLPYGYEILTENLMDPSHVPYAHYGLGAQVPMKNSSLKNAGKPLDLRLEWLDESGFQGKQVTGFSKFIPPCVYFSHQTFETSKKGKPQASISGTERDKMKAICLIFMCIPVSPGRSRLIWAFPRNFALWAYRLVPRWLTHIQQNLFLDSDLYFLHLEERKLQNYGKQNWEKACYVPTAADAFVVAFRKWLKRYSNNGVDWGKRFDGSLPPSPPKEQLMDRYWSHVVKCRSCKGALNAFRTLEITTQVISIASVGMLGVIATTKRASSSSLYVWITPLVCSALICCLASRWLSHFIYKTYYFHDYNHALIK